MLPTNRGCSWTRWYCSTPLLQDRVPRPVAPGSLATIMGTRFGGKNVAVTFDGLAAQVLFSNDTQINVLVPAGLGAKSSAQVIVSVDGIQSVSQPVALAPMAPAIFPGAV